MARNGSGSPSRTSPCGPSVSGCTCGSLPNSPSDGSRWSGSPRSISGLAAVVAGATVEGDARTVLWLGAALLDLVAALSSGRRGSFELDLLHFIERHALFVILVLGELLIAAGIPVAAAERDAPVVVAGALGVTMTCLLWWTYFAHVKPSLEELLAGGGEPMTKVARDAYSLLHFPALAGAVTLAAAAEEVVAHPTDEGGTALLVAFATGLSLWMVGLSAAHRRVTGSWLVHRVAIVVLAWAALWAVRDMAATALFAVGVAALAAVAVVEEVVVDRPALRRPPLRRADQSG